jgi:hypothetical protein
VRFRPSVPLDRRRLALAGCVAIVLGLYLAIAMQYGRSIRPAANQRDVHNLIADAFQHGHARLPLAVPPGLAALPDPYDPGANAPFRAAGLHDLSYYQGAIYSYFGPTPALSLLLPFRLLGLGDVTPLLATLVFLSVGYLFLALLYLRLARLLPRPPGLLLDCVALLLLGLATTAPFIMHAGRTYEETIAAGLCFVAAGAYFLARAFTQTAHRATFCALASASLGIAVGARPDLVVYSLLIVVAAVIVAVRGTGRVRIVLALLVPLAVFGCMLAAYNYTRFHSIAEFGSSYQLAGLNMHPYVFRQAWYIPLGLYYYLLAVPRFDSSFPFIRLLPSTLNGSYPTLYSYEPVAGLLVAVPAVPFGITALVAVGPRLMRQAAWLYAGLATATIASCLVVVFVAWQFNSATMRYELDFAPMLVLVAALGYGCLCGLMGGNLRRVAIAVWVIAAFVGIAFNLATAWTPCAGTGSC